MYGAECGDVLLLAVDPDSRRVICHAFKLSMRRKCGTIPCLTFGNEIIYFS